jgi:hypothetical protein
MGLTEKEIVEGLVFCSVFGIALWTVLQALGRAWFRWGNGHRTWDLIRKSHKRPYDGRDSRG